jgi:chorismate mutase
MKDIENLRKELDAVDEQILELIAKRQELSRQIGRKKSEESLSPFDKNREAQLEKMWTAKAKALGLESEPILRILTELFEISKKVQNKIRNQN